MFGLKPLDRVNIDSILLQYPYRYYVFGSRAKGAQKERSDLDLCIVGDVSFELFARIKTQLDESPLSCKVDIVAWNRISDEFKKHIKNDLVTYIPDPLLGAHMVDLSHPLTSDIPTWDGGCGFVLQSLYVPEMLFDVQKITMNAGVGTHMDAPSHTVREGQDVAHFPLSNCYTYCHVVDLSQEVTQDTVITREMLLSYEQEYGIFAEKSWVFIMTGWGKKWQDSHTYRNPDQQGIMRFPILDSKASELLILRNIAGMGIDTLSPDRDGGDFLVHKMLLSAGIFIIENLAYVPQLPAYGYCLVTSLPIVGGSESPVRVLFMYRQM